MSIKLQQALLTNFVAGSFSLPIAYENSKYEPVLGTAYAELKTFVNDDTAFNLKTSNETDGYLQCILRYPTDGSDGPAKLKADAIKAQFPIGLSLTYSGQELTITKRSASAGYPEDGWYKIVVKIFFVAILPR